MKISFFTMGKDELNYFLKECLLSAQDIVDEIIYIDTGSTDGSVEWVVDNIPNAKVYNYPWPGWEQSNKVRNFAIEKCSGDYILTIDADEVFGKSAKKIREILEKYPETESFHLQGEHYMFDLIHQDKSVKTHLWQNRLFKNLSHLKYPENQHGLVQPESCLSLFGDFIHHYGHCKNMSLALRRYDENAGDKNEWPEEHKQSREDYLKWQLYCMMTGSYPMKKCSLENHPEIIQKKFHIPEIKLWVEKNVKK
ncbi:MAG: glycosyltransferase [bacterium]